MIKNTLKLVCTSRIFVQLHNEIQGKYLGDYLEDWSLSFFALTSYERLRLRIINDVLFFLLFDLNIDDVAHLLSTFPSVNSRRDLETRQTTLTLVAFHDLKCLGLDAFLNLNNGEGWMLPDTLRLADYNLGHDARAQAPQPVAARIGAETAKLWGSSVVNRESSVENAPTHDLRLTTHAHYRFLPWQLQSTPAESWAECERHAENLRRLLGTPESSVVNQESPVGEETPSPSRNPDGQLNLIPPDEEQLRLF